MKQLILTFILLGFIGSGFSAMAASRTRSAESGSQVSLGATHILPSAFVIPGGVIILGTTAGIGFFDLFDISTNLYMDAVGVYNIGAKVGLYHSSDYAFALFANYSSQTVKTLAVDPNNTANIIERDQTLTTFAPGGVFSYRILDELAGHAGVSFAQRNPAIAKGDLKKRTAYVQGTTLFKEFSLYVTEKVTFATGASYDTTYDIWGAGASFHIGGFHIGAHYYFNVTEGSIAPIIGGGYTTSL